MLFFFSFARLHKFAYLQKKLYNILYSVFVYCKKLVLTPMTFVVFYPAIATDTTACVKYCKIT